MTKRTTPRQCARNTYGSRRTYRVRPGLDSLERRDVPTQFMVLNANDNGTGSLRQAILDANAFPGTDSITFDPVVFATPKTIGLVTGALQMSDAVTIVGPGAGLLTISGNQLSGVITALSAPSDAPMTTLSNVSISNGRDGGVFSARPLTLLNCVVSDNVGTLGGGIYSFGTPFDNAHTPLFVEHCVIHNNAANTGGGIYTLASVATIEDTVISGNTSSTWGGGAYLDGAQTFITRCTISDNHANGTYGQGGGILVLGSRFGISTIANSTISGNSAILSGGGLYAYHPAIAIQNCTITSNVAAVGGGCGMNLNTAGYSVFTAQSSLIAGNTATYTPSTSDATRALDYGGMLPQGDHNLIGVADGTLFNGPGNMSGTTSAPLDPMLGPLANNGGPTKTHALLPGSPAIDTGANSGSVLTDQRGGGFVRVYGAAADIGAYEVQVSPPRIQSTIVNDGSAQRSRVTSLTVTFNTQVTLSGAVANAFTLSRTGGKTVSVAASATIVNGVTVVTLSKFTGAETQFGSLADGRYALAAFATNISSNGQQLDGNGDGTPGDNYTFGEAQGLYRLFGDINGDRRVDIADFGLFSVSYLSQPNYNAAFDFNGDGHVDILDFGQLSLRYLRPLP